METSVMNGMCRCCASEGAFKDVKSSYHWMGQEEVYGDMLRECFDISLSISEGEQGSICELCITQLRNAVNFKKQVLHTEDQFKTQLQNKLFKPSIVKVELPADDINDSGDNLSADEDYSGPEFEVPIKTETPDEPKVKKRAAKATTSRAKRAKTNAGETSTKQVGSLNCDICDWRFTSLFNLKRHLIHIHGKHVTATSRTLCDGCGKMFFNAQWLAKHLAKGCPTSDCKVCTECSITFGTKSDMYKHMRKMHWSEYRFLNLNCPLCSESLKSHEEHDAHLSGEHNVQLVFEDLTFDCTEGTDGDAPGRRKKKRKSDESATPERVEHRVNLTAILQHSNASPFRDKTMRGFSCLYCAKAFLNLDDLREHTAQQSEKDKINTIIDYKLSYNPIKVDITNLQCTVCDLDMKDLNDLKDHLVAIHNKTIYRHIKDIILPFRLDDGNNYTCVVCSVVHISFKNLYHHMSSHYRNYCCKKCGAGYITIAALRKHGKTHAQGIFPCEYCDKSYTSLTKKRNHEKGVHTGGWLRNKCPHCPEIFVSYYDRSEHLVKVHHETPIIYPCNACNKTYKKKFELNRHIKHHHLQQRSFLCDKCNAKFFSKRGLADHLTRHAGGEVCSCDVCGKMFSRLRTLKEHMKLHEDDKRFQCGACNKTFMQKCSLKSHLRLHQDDLDIFKEFDDVKHLIDNREMTLKQIAVENKKKAQAKKEVNRFA